MAEQSLQGTIIGNFVVGEKVGEGGMGVVYGATHRRLPRRAAVKVLRPEASRDVELTRRFFNEALSASGLDNPHVVEVLDYGELEDGRAYIVMEWLEGRSLADALLAEGRMGVRQTLHVVAGMCEALRAAHAHGIVHRDLKPDNVFLVNKGDDSHFVKVLDFGVAKLTAKSLPGGGARGSGYKTRTGIVIGTPAYMSPEQWQGTHMVDHRSDVYSLGLIAYELLTGQLPCVHGEGADMVIAHVYETPPPPSALNPEVPPWLDEVIGRALAKAPADRFASMNDLTLALSARGAASPRPVASSGAPPTNTRKPPAATAPPSLPHITTMRGTSGEIARLAETEEGRGTRGWLMPLATMAAVGVAITAGILFTGQGGDQRRGSLGPMTVMEPALGAPPAQWPAGLATPEPPANDAGVAAD